MNKYQLAKIISIANGIESRKRVQKTVHLLQSAGCPLNVHDFRLHYYGPYSKSLARLVDEMASSGMLVEEESSSQPGPQYDYELDPCAEERLLEIEKTPSGELQKEEIEKFGPLLDRLCATKPRVLELASTLVEFRNVGKTDDDALEETADFKNEDVNSSAMSEAMELAEEVLTWEE